MKLQDLLDYMQRSNTDIFGQLPSMYGHRVPPKIQSGDYDMQGFNSDPSMDLSVRFLGDTPHRPDKYKLPNSPTFSDESVYDSPIFKGGKWQNIGNNLWNFVPSGTNLRNMPIRGLIDYFLTKERKGTTLQIGDKFFEGTQ